MLDRFAHRSHRAGLWQPGPRGARRHKKDAGAPPAAPDPAVTAAAQANANADTARLQANLNRVDQYGPYGSVTYTDLGNDHWRQDTTLSPDQAAAVQSDQALTKGLYGLANGQLGRIQGAIATPFDTANLPAAADPNSGADARDAVTAALMARQQPMLDQQRARTENQLANQGVMRGSEAYGAAQDDLGRTENDARMSAVLAGGQEQSRVFDLMQSARGNAIQEQNYLREQPLNEAIALMGGGQIQNPTFGQAPQVGVAPTDVMGAYSLNQSAQNAGYQGRVASANAQNSATAAAGRSRRPALPPWRSSDAASIRMMRRSAT
jgi:hypothetical protein